MDRTRTAAFQTEVEFTLPKGYVDEPASLHRRGVMRLATAADEILPLRDPRVQQNPAYLDVIVLARVDHAAGQPAASRHPGHRGAVRLATSTICSGSTSRSTAPRSPRASRRLPRAAPTASRPGACPSWGKPDGLPRGRCTGRWRSSPPISTGAAKR